MEIPRDRYLQQLIDSQHNGMIKIITGIRRCGKSFLLFNLFKRHLLQQGMPADHILEVSLDSIGDEPLRDPHACFQHIHEAINDKQPYVLLLDEVQFMPRFEEVLNGLSRLANLDIYVTGSNSRFLSSDIVTEFRGRGDEIRVFPLSFAEFFATTSHDFDEAWQTYMTYGGLPQLVQLTTDLKKTRYLQNLLNTLYLKDVVERNQLHHAQELDTLVDVLASCIGSPTNPTRLANTFLTQARTTVTNKTISTYIQHLMESFLIDRAMRYDIKGRKHIGANFKYYFTDLGLRNARLTFRQQEPTHILENIVYNELKIRGYAVDTGTVTTYATSPNGTPIRKQLEVDFVANQGSQRYYIQVAHTMDTQEKQAQKMASLSHIPDAFKKIILINGTQKPWHNQDGFLIMGIKHFLLNNKSLDL